MEPGIVLPEALDRLVAPIGIVVKQNHFDSATGMPIAEDSEIADLEGTHSWSPVLRFARRRVFQVGLLLLGSSSMTHPMIGPNSGELSGFRRIAPRPAG